MIILNFDWMAISVIQTASNMATVRPKLLEALLLWVNF